MTTLSQSRIRSTAINRQPDRVDTSESWRAIYDARGDVIGSIRSSFGAFEARDRQHHALGLAFPTYDAAVSALERGRQ
jgi:hypothetical protein